MKKVFKITLVALLLILNILCLFSIRPIESQQIVAQNEYGRLAITVLELNTNKPVDNASICIVESREYYSTNKNGLTDTIQVPILKNNNLNNSLQTNWGEITLLVYKPGFADHVAFYQSVPIKQTRLGVVVYLTPIYSADDTLPTITTNAPNNIWIKELIKTYKK